MLAGLMRAHVAERTARVVEGFAAPAPGSHRTALDLDAFGDQLVRLLAAYLEDPRG